MLFLFRNLAGVASVLQGGFPLSRPGRLAQEVHGCCEGRDPAHWGSLRWRGERHSHLRRSGWLTMGVSIEVDQRILTFFHDHWPMPEDREKYIQARETKPSRVEEARRIIDDYVDDLREIIKTLKRKMN